MDGRKTPTAASAAAAPTEFIKRRVKRPPMPKRRLRVYALDPSLGKTLDSLAVNETTLAVPWDDKWDDSNRLAVALKPGPIGEYLEVVDIDPASNKIYDPVDLNDKKLLAQDGWPPSEGNPQFHQQMVYAVAMTTIDHFEQALGRKVLWSPRMIGDGTAKNKVKVYEVPRLRLYPHALRTDNAYYSPQKKALLFGYFPSSSTNDDATAPGTMVFACLSSDIIAHEMTHALLDGLHRRFEEASNPDVPAFHEGFADTVALFQHFMIPELVRHEIARVRSDLLAESLLGGLAKQFGEGMGQRAPLRDYTKATNESLRYCDEVTEPHTRGSILVCAVYDAFRKIVARRTADLIRIATGGSGVLPSGALHPDLVERLTAETCKTAKHVLLICIRALDYCPVVDITFGEYLRALITADIDMVTEDRYGYRVAFMESFRKWGILPSGVRTISEETLSWNTPTDPKPEWLRSVVRSIDLVWNRDLDRSGIYHLQQKNCKNVWLALNKVLQANPSLYEQLGLKAGVPAYYENGTIKEARPAPRSNFEVHSVRPARRVTPDGELRPEIIVVIAQRQAVQIDDKDASKGFFWFRSGATLIIDPSDRHESIRYIIIKTPDKGRLDAQRKMVTDTSLTPLRSLYFGNQITAAGAATDEPFAALHAARLEYGNG
jgi:hypothetical protein